MLEFLLSSILKKKKKKTKKHSTGSNKKSRKTKKLTSSKRSNIKYKRGGKLDNGLTYLLSNYPKANGVTVVLGVKTGSINETKKTQGISHFLEHMMFRGTETSGTQTIMSQKLEKYGARLNATTSKHITIYYITTVASKLEKTIEMLADIIRNSRFVCLDMDSEKKIVIQEMKNKHNDPDIHSSVSIISQHLRNTPYQHLVIGDQESVKSLERYQLMAYMVANYHPKNMGIVIYGNIKDNDKSTIKSIKKYFNNDILIKYRLDRTDDDYDKYKKQLDDFKKQNKYIESYDATKSLKNQTKLNFISEVQKGLTQTLIRIAFTGIHMNDSKNNTQSYIKRILTTGMSSRMFNTIRRSEGLTYSIKMNQYSYKHCGVIVFEINTNTDSDTVKIAIGKVIKELDKLKHDLVSSSEIKIARRKIDTNNYHHKTDTKEMAVRIIEDQMFSKNYRSIECKKDDKKDECPVSNIDIRNFAKKIFNRSNMTIFILGPKKYLRPDIFF